MSEIKNTTEDFSQFKDSNLEMDKFVDRSMEIIDRIHQILEVTGQTQKDLANKLNKSESEISKWLNGVHNLTLKTISKLEVALGESIILPVNGTDYQKVIDQSYMKYIMINKMGVKSFNKGDELANLNNVSTMKSEYDLHLFNFEVNKKNMIEDENNDVVLFSLDDKIINIDVKSHIEVIPVLDNNQEGQKRYSLEDYMKLESKSNEENSNKERFFWNDGLIYEKKNIDKPSSITLNDSNYVHYSSKLKRLISVESDMIFTRFAEGAGKFKGSKKGSKFNEENPNFSISMDFEEIL